MKRAAGLFASMVSLTLPVGAYDDLTILSDEFDAAHTITI